jgi:predicted deacylase
MPRRVPLALLAVLLAAGAVQAQPATATSAPAPSSAAIASAKPAGVLAEGTRWATPYYVVDSGKEGPTVMVVGGIHGNEPAGAAAAGQIRHWRLARGKLVVLPRANVPGLEAKQRRLPGIDRDRSDLNRNFPQKDDAKPAGRPAEAIWELVTRLRPDWLVDLHESVNFRKADPKRVGNTIIHAVADDTRRQALAMIEAVNTGIDEEGKQFILLRNPAKGSLARSAADRLGVRAMIVETTRRDQPLALRVRQHRLMVHRLLADLGMVAVSEDSLRPAVEAEAGR